MRILSTYLALPAKVVLAFSALLFFAVEGNCGEKKENKLAFLASDPSEAVQESVEWVRDKKDNQKLPYAVIDKSYSGVYVFDDKGKFIAAGPVLLGIAKRDRIDPKTLNYKLSQITPDKRVTPSGRYRSFLGKDRRGKELLWVDYQYAIAIHPVADVRGQNRKTRLKTKTHSDNRITWGCINVDPELFKNVITPLFQERGGMVYVLPEEPENRGILQIVDKG